jgi:uncharacterized protein (TIGR01777 family)
MRVVITGATGFIGKSLCERLSGRYEIVGLSRNAEKAERQLGGLAKVVQWEAGRKGDWEREIDGAYAVVNLAGENIGSGRWTKAKKARILDSRIDAANALVEAVGRVKNKPKVLIQTSAVGYYGPRGDERLDDNSAAGSGFLSDVCRQVEAAARKVEQAGVRYVAIRTGLVLGLSGGALPKMMLPFKSFLGGHAGRGEQWLSWISLEDETAAIEFLIENEQLSGPFNLTAPNPVTAKQFAKTLGRVLKRPACLPAPAFVLKILLGQMAEELLLKGQRVLPKRLVEAGFEFNEKTLQEALLAIFKKN